NCSCAASEVGRISAQRVIRREAAGGLRFANPPYARAAEIVRHRRSGVAGISTWRMPSGESASTSAFATAGIAPTQPASPAPLTPSGLVLVGDGLLTTSTGLRFAACGIA